jgi:hypothetical protein
MIVKYLLHFMAAIHQPMHLGFRKDVGGTKLFLNDPPTTLHNVWNETLFEHHLDMGASQNKGRLWNYYAVYEDRTESSTASP